MNQLVKSPNSLILLEEVSDTGESLLNHRWHLCKIDHPLCYLKKNQTHVILPGCVLHWAIQQLKSDEP